jgi:exopolysaccharide production protein ExoQ
VIHPELHSLVLTPLANPAPIAEAPAVATSKPSHWIWLPWIWLFIASTRSVDLWLMGGSVDPATTDLMDLAGTQWDRLVLTTLIVLSLFVLYSRAERAKKILVRNKWLVVLFFYIALSILWSNFPDISFRRCLRSVGMLVVVLVALTERDPLDAIRALLRRVYFVHIPLSIAAIKYFRHIGVAYNWAGTEEMWTGLATHKNCLGQVAMCASLLCTWQILQNWGKKKLTLDLLFLVLSLWVLRGSPSSHSSTAILGFVASAAVLFGLQFVKKRAARAKQIVLAAIVLFVLSIPLVSLAFEALDTTPAELVLETTGRDITLTGRTNLWIDVLNNAKKNPVLGVGYGAFWVGHIGYNMYPLSSWSRVTPGWRPNQGHNGYIDVFVDLGVIGVILLLIILGSAFSGAFNDLSNNFEFARLRLALLVSIVINNAAEASFFKGTHALWFVFLLVCINVPSATKQALPADAA